MKSLKIIWLQAGVVEALKVLLPAPIPADSDAHKAGSEICSPGLHLGSLRALGEAFWA